MEVKEAEFKTKEDIIKSMKSGKKVDFKETLKAYSIPIISVTIFLLILVLVIYPTANSIFDNYQQLEKLQTDKKTNQDSIDKLTVLKNRDTQTLSDLSIIDLIVPSEKTKIVGLQQFIEDKTKQYNLTLKDITVGERLQNVTNLTTDQSAVSDQTNPIKQTQDSLRVAPTTAKIEGKFSDIQSFFADFYKVADLYIISTMNLKSSGSIAPADLSTSSVIWSLDITFSKYAFSEDFLSNESAFTQIPVSAAPDDTVVKYLRERYAK